MTDPVRNPLRDPNRSTLPLAWVESELADSESESDLGLLWVPVRAP